MKQIKIFDTTLRDGQQCPGAGMSFENNIAYAKLAMKLGIDVLEAGFPSASKLDSDIVKTICKEISHNPASPIIAGLCQLKEDQIDKTIEALEPAIANKKARLHTYLPVDPELIVASLGSERAKQKNEIINDLSRFVETAVSAGLEVEFSPEGYSRMAENFDFVTDLIRAAVSSGATIINCPDTIGGGCILQGKDYFVEKMNLHAEIISSEFPDKDITWSAHCHNDFGLAVPNTLNSIVYGPVTQIEGCINGVGERAGNASLEQCIMIIKHFGEIDNLKNKFFTNINTEYIQEISDFISKYMLPRQPHFPVTGENSTKHSSGGHTNAILKNPLAYQPFDPKEIGKEISFVFGPLSGGNHAKSVIEDAGYLCDDAEKAIIAQFIKDFYHDRRKGITENELIKGYFEFRKPISIENFDYSRSANKSSVHIRGKLFSKEGLIERSHEGPDSALAALKSVVDEFYPASIQSHRSESEGEGINARSISTILVKDDNGNIYEGIGADSDIEISAMKAFISAINNAYVRTNFGKKS